MIICITNRLLCENNFLEQVDKIASSGICSILLREKDLQGAEYEALAKACLVICRRYGTELILHSHINIAEKLGVQNIQLPFEKFRQSRNGLAGFKKTGVSVHSKEEAIFAQNNGTQYVIAGHIFATDCKKGLEPRGTGFLSEICSAVSIPVFAIGGISPDTMETVKKAGASGICIMSPLMKSHHPCNLLQQYASSLSV